MSRILVVTYYYPPSTASGANRWAAMVRHMRRLGHRVWVVTSAGAGSGPTASDPDVVRAPDLVTSPLLRAALRRPALARPGDAPFETPAPALLTRVVVPDAYAISWAPWAFLHARRAIARHGIDCLITSGPPQSTHLIALLLGRRRPAWVADLRDGWTFEQLERPWPTTAQRRFDRWLERAVAVAADGAMGATRPIADDLARRLGANARWVSNGWDPLAEGDVAAAARDLPPADAAVATLVHTGTLSGPRGRDPRAFLEALARYNSGAPARPVELVLAGRLSAEDDELLRESPGGRWVRHVGLLERPTAVALQRSADALLLLTGTDASEATGKLFEYLASGRPVIALARANEASRIVEMTGCGLLVAPGDAAALAEALDRLARGTLPFAPDTAEIERFVYPGPARSALALVDDAIARRRRA